MSEAVQLPTSLRANPRLDRWLRFEADGSVCVQSGKVEMGQGILTALAQVVADGLGVPLERVRMAAARTGSHPDEGVTSGSLSVQESGAALRHVCAEARDLHLREAARRWALPLDAVRCEAGVFHAVDGRQAAYADLADARLLEREATPGAVPSIARSRVGAPVQRLDIPDKVHGRPRFLHDLALPGMLHGRVLRPRNGACVVLEADLAPVRACAGVLAVVQDGRMFGVVAASSAEADAALARLVRSVRWNEPAVLPDEAALPCWLQSTPVETTVVLEQPGQGERIARTLSATMGRV